MEHSQNPRDAHIQACQNQVIAYLSANPEQSAATHTISGAVTDGLQCIVSQGSHQVRMDMGKPMGGDGTAPSPGFFAKAGLLGCIAIAVKMTAAREGLTFRAVHVDIETDTDTLAIFGLGSGNAAPLDNRVKILIDTDETSDAIDDLVSRVLTTDTWFLALRDAQSVSVDWERQPSRAASP